MGVVRFDNKGGGACRCIQSASRCVVQEHSPMTVSEQKRASSPLEALCLLIEYLLLIPSLIANIISTTCTLLTSVVA